MSGVNCDVSDETLQYCKEFLEEYPEAPNWDKSFVGQLVVSFLINKKTRIILLLLYCIALLNIEGNSSENQDHSKQGKSQ